MTVSPIFSCKCGAVACTKAAFAQYSPARQARHLIEIRTCPTCEYDRGVHRKAMKIVNEINPALGFRYGN